MQPNTAKVELSLNRFEVICRWGEPIDMDWTRSQLEAWLQRRMDASPATVYDLGVQAKGTDHG